MSDGLDKKVDTSLMQKMIATRMLRCCYMSQVGDVGFQGVDSNGQGGWHSASFEVVAATYIVESPLRERVDSEPLSLVTKNNN